jgi:hypothetical protein
MTEREQRKLAEQLAAGSKFVTFNSALLLVRHAPAEAEDLIREREESEQKQEELSRAFQRLRIAARELR